MFFWLLCTQFYTPIFGLFYTQYSLLITIIHCCWYITIMLYIYIFIPTLYPSALIHTYIYIYITTIPIVSPAPCLILYSAYVYIYIYIYIHITIVAGISQYTIYIWRFPMSWGVPWHLPRWPLSPAPPCRCCSTPWWPRSPRHGETLGKWSRNGGWTPSMDWFKGKF